jgi:hypothetical protein
LAQYTGEQTTATKYVHFTGSSSIVKRINWMRSDNTLHATATLQEDFKLRYQIKTVMDKLPMQYTLEHVVRLTADEHTRGEMVTITNKQAKHLHETQPHPGNAVEMVTANQALLMIRKQVAPNNMFSKITCGRKD